MQPLAGGPRTEAPEAQAAALEFSPLRRTPRGAWWLGTLQGHGCCCGRAPVVSSPDGIVTTWNKLGGTYEATCHLLNETGDLTLNLDCVFLVVEMDLHYAKYAPSLCPPYGISCNLGCHCESLIKVFLRETMTHRSKTHGSSWVCVALATEYGFDPECKLGFLPTLPHHLAEASSPSEGRRGPQLQNEGNNNLIIQVTVRIK